MLHLQTVTSPATFIMLLSCVLGAGFMVRFLVALTLDEKKKMHAEYTRHRSGLHYASDTASVGAGYRKTAVNSAAHLAIGVVRITAALASDGSRRRRTAPVGPLHVLKLGTPARELNFTAEHRYRSG
jgi:hypothetical protein